MSGTGDSALLELFREEVRANVQVLNDGLVALEQNPGNVGQIELLMRAAHSVKGAARVVNIDAAVTLAHAAEDCLVAAQERRITLDANDIDTLLAAADLLAGIAESGRAESPAMVGPERWRNRRAGGGVEKTSQRRKKPDPGSKNAFRGSRGSICPDRPGAACFRSGDRGGLFASLRIVTYGRLVSRRG